jgi:hypothetical protein
VREDYQEFGGSVGGGYCEKTVREDYQKKFESSVGEGYCKGLVGEGNCEGRL